MICDPTHSGTHCYKQHRFQVSSVKSSMHTQRARGPQHGVLQNVREYSHLTRVRISADANVQSSRVTCTVQVQFVRVRVVIIPNHGG